VVADAVLHVAGVRLLPDPQRVLFLVLLLLFLGGPATAAAVAPEPPQDPVGPGGFTLLTAGQRAEKAELKLRDKDGLFHS